MVSNKNNYAFIDAQNVYFSIKRSGWKLDFGRFRKYLEDKYSVSKSYLFIGYRASNESLYTFLQQAGFICVFKPIIESFGKAKGNVDAELVLHVMIEFPNYDKAVIVTGDGDFYCLAEYLFKQNKLERILAPNELEYSGLLKKLGTSDLKIIEFMNPLRNKLEIKD